MSVRGLGLSLAVVSVVFPVPLLADGVNAGLSDPIVVVAAPSGAGSTNLAGVPDLLPGSNQVGRSDAPLDTVGGYDVHIAYDHVAVGAAVVGVLFLMTKWMGALARSS